MRNKPNIVNTSSDMWQIKIADTQLLKESLCCCCLKSRFDIKTGIWLS